MIQQSFIDIAINPLDSKAQNNFIDEILKLQKANDILGIAYIRMYIAVKPMSAFHGHLLMIQDGHDFAWMYDCDCESILIEYAKEHVLDYFSSLSDEDQCTLSLQGFEI